LLEHLKTALGDWIKEAPNYDDITILVIGRKSKSPSLLKRAKKA
jgi:hypothetical protein